MLNHVSEEQLALYVAGDLPDTHTNSVRVHLEACTHCRATLSELKQSRALLTSSFAEPDIQDLFEVRACRYCQAGSASDGSKTLEMGPGCSRSRNRLSPPSAVYAKARTIAVTSEARDYTAVAGSHSTEPSLAAAPAPGKTIPN